MTITKKNIYIFIFLGVKTSEVCETQVAEEDKTDCYIYP